MLANWRKRMTLFFAKGRIAWICAMVFGVILVVVGAVLSPPNVFLIVTGAAFFVLGLIFLIISLVTKGQSD
jgi:hypothetical protein